jgi:hypothetical protein
MRQNVLRFAFPHLEGWLDEQGEADMAGERPSEPFPQSLRVALVADLEPLVRYSQKAAELEARADRAAQVMKDLNVTMMPPAWTSRSAEDEEEQIAGAKLRLAQVTATPSFSARAAVVEAIESPEVEGCGAMTRVTP